MAKRRLMMARLAPAGMLTALSGCAQLSGVNDLVFESTSDGGMDVEAADAGDGANDAVDDTGLDVSESGLDVTDSSNPCELDASTTGVGAIGEVCCEPLGCAGHAQKLVLYCDPNTGTWAALQSCAGLQLCDTAPGSSRGSCQDPEPLCIGKAPGDRLCNGSIAMECGPDLVSATVTPCAYACKNGECEGGCTPESRQCDGNTPRFCDGEGLWQAEAPCPYVCVEDGQCGGVCLPGDVHCKGNVPESCNGAGQWVAEQPCPDVCALGVCATQCDDGTKQCQGSVPQACVSGAWDDGDPCPFACSQGECVGVCEPGTKRCSGLLPQTCDASGVWKDGTPCPYVCIEGGCTGVCSPTSKTCNGLTPRVCSVEGQWVSEAPCAYICSNGNCSGVCSPGSGQCAGQVPQTCDGLGQWQSGPACPFACTAGVCTGACQPSATQCNGNVVQTCDVGGQWQDTNTCQYVCMNGTCAGVCVPGSKRCTGLIPQSCDASGQWQNLATCAYVCDQGACTGVCTPTTTVCVGNTLKTCSSSGQWNAGTACSGSTPICSEGQCTQQPSCVGSTGMGCGDGTKNCCASGVVPGGSFLRSNSTGAPATVGSFRMDSYEVTVGRFRNFVAAYPGNKPLGGMGKNPLDPSDPGWNAAWNTILPADQATLKQVLKTPGDCDGYAWTDDVGSKEYFPINCVSWYEAFAFCIWDGGRLPTEAEWNFAAAGGDEQRIYPWSSPPSSTTIDATYAVYSPASLVNVGSRSPKGDGRWGQSDLAGSLWEWVRDWYASQYPTPCVNCANHTPAVGRVFRGGGFYGNQNDQRAAIRDYDVPASRDDGYGIRCVRDP